MSITLSDEQWDEVQRVLERLSALAGFKLVLSDLIANWVSFVADCERGYQDNMDEYINDLGIRIVLQNLVLNTSPSTAEQISTRLDASDRRFIATTTSLDEPIVQLDHDPNQIEKMLYFRLPRKMHKELESECQKFRKGGRLWL